MALQRKQAPESISSSLSRKGERPIDPAILRRVAANVPVLSDGLRQKFLAQFTDGECEAIGVRVRSEGVVRDALRWLPTLVEALAAHPAELCRYSPTRLAWLVECVGTLQEKVLQQEAEALESEAQEEPSPSEESPSSLADVRLRGRIVVEMRFVMSVFERAHERDRTIERLVPGPGTRHVLVRKRRASVPRIDLPPEGLILKPSEPPPEPPEES